MRKIFCCVNAIIVSMMIGGCDIVQENVIDIGGAGDFIAINMALNDTIKLSGGIAIGTAKVMDIHEGNILKLIFVPAEKYSKKKFKTNFTLHDKREIKDRSEFEYAIENTEPDMYKVSMSAIYEDDDNSISSMTSFYLNVK